MHHGIEASAWGLSAFFFFFYTLCFFTVNLLPFLSASSDGLDFCSSLFSSRHVMIADAGMAAVASTIFVSIALGALLERLGRVYVQSGQLLFGSCGLNNLCSYCAWHFVGALGPSIRTIKFAGLLGFFSLAATASVWLFPGGLKVQYLHFWCVFQIRFGHDLSLPLLVFLLWGGGLLLLDVFVLGLGSLMDRLSYDVDPAVKEYFDLSTGASFSEVAAGVEYSEETGFWEVVGNAPSAPGPCTCSSACWVGAATCACSQRPRPVHSTASVILLRQQKGSIRTTTQFWG